jgi:hypothetical protein
MIRVMTAVMIAIMILMREPFDAISEQVRAQIDHVIPVRLRCRIACGNLCR